MRSRYMPFKTQIKVRRIIQALLLMFPTSFAAFHSVITEKMCHL